MSDSDDSVELGYGGAKVTHKISKGVASVGDPYVEIIEHPQSRGIRFRYKSEGPSHGGLQGESSSRGKKTYPAIKIHNYEGPAIVFVTLVTDQDPPQPHAHELVGKNCTDGRCSFEIRLHRAMNIPFPNLSVQHVTKKSVLKTLEQRIRENRYPFQEIPQKLQEEEITSIREEAKKRANDIPLSVVRLQFEVLLKPEGRAHRRLPPAYSKPIYDSKSPAAAALKICRMDKQAGCCRGHEEVFLLCDKVQKDDIKVRFFEKDHRGVLKWEAEGNFAPSDVHRQYAIVFTTPPYQNQNIDHPVEVKIQLVRKSDDEESEAKAFTYCPQRDKEEIQRKRRKKILMPVYPDGGAEGEDQVFERRQEFPTKHLPANKMQEADSFGGFEEADTGRIIEPEHKIRPLKTRVDHGNIQRGVMGEKDVGCQTELHPEEELKDRYTANYKGTLAYSIAERSTAGLLQYAVTSDTKSLLHVQRYLLGVKDEEGDTPLDIAIVNKNKDVAKAMVEVAATIQDADFLNITNTDGQSAVHLAVIYKQHEVFDSLLRCYADPSVQDNDGNTAAHIIAMEDDKKCMEVLLKYRDNKLYKDNVVDMSWANKKNHEGVTPLHLAVRCQSLYCVKALLKAKVDPNIEDAKSGRTALHICADVNNIGILGALLTEGNPDVNIRDYDGLTPLHIAVSRGSIGMAALLMLRGADPNIESNRTANTAHVDDEAEECAAAQQDGVRGETPMDFAKQLKNLENDKKKLIRILEGESYANVSSVAKGMQGVKFNPHDDLPPIDSLYNSLNDLGVQALPQGDILDLNFGVRYKLAQVLDKDNSARGWRGLAEKIDLDALIEPLGREKSPTMALLDNYEVIDGTVAKLKEALTAINRPDLIKVLDQHAKVVTKRRSKANGPKSLDSGYLSVAHSASATKSLPTVTGNRDKSRKD
ncbi:nuclear factor NF-kappa-B p105 subunit-like isoform X2 [Lineus longissimus]|uniref:nuclear factor NF-kappa-B p105 subunit-like isoform X2 n=1 Tax=Lineus longissimus TaxID=88925 RepID=UPI00315DFFED